jgi:hypothetical protein
VEKYNISFSGKILPGLDLAPIKERFAAQFKIYESSRVDACFTGKRILLGRNLNKEDATSLYGKLKQLGMMCQIEQVKAEPVKTEPVALQQIAAKKAKTKNTWKAPSAPRRRRQPGAPNLFDLQISERAGINGGNVAGNKVLATAPILAAAIVLLAFCLVGLRFWAQGQTKQDAGLSSVAIDPGQQPLVQIGDQLLFHDRAGLATRDASLASVGLQQARVIDFFSNGDLLVLQPPPAAKLPAPLQQWFGAPAITGDILLRCEPGNYQCASLLTGLGPAGILVDRRTDQLYLADASADSLRKLGADGTIIATRAIKLSSPLHLYLQEGILYLTQAGSDAVLVLKPDDHEFGKTLDSINLEMPAASQSGHIFPGAVAWFNQRWWALVQSHDASAAGLYLFNGRWEFERQVELADGAHPAALTAWAAKMLVSDSDNERIYRFDAAARAEKNFNSISMAASLDARQSGLGLSVLLQQSVLLILLVTAAVLLAFGLLRSLRDKVFTAPADSNERSFDINNTDIEWLDPAPDLENRLRKAGNGLAGVATLLLLGAFIAQFSIWSMIALTLVLAGCGGYYFALQRASLSHLGLLDGKLIVVDHTNTYRVGSGPNIQFFSNFIMIDDVIVYLGNRLLHQFASQPLQEKFRPVVYTGIRIDRATLQVKLLQRRHPLLLGALGLLSAVVCALLLVLLT